MDTVTYPNEDVARMLNEEFVCAKPRLSEHKDLARKYGVKWTPGLVWLDGEGTKRHENVGFFEPQELMAECVYGAARVAVGGGDWKTAKGHLERVVERWPDTFAAPAALYWTGVAAKMESGKAEPLVERWRQLLADYPDSAWAMKVSFVKK